MTQTPDNPRTTVTVLSELVKPTDRQREFLQAVRGHTFTLYGGAAGGGKSYILRWGLIGLLLKWAGEQKPGVRVGLFCEDYPTLQDRQVGKLKLEVPTWLGEVKDSINEGLGLYLKPRWGGGAILLRNLDKPEKYQSAEFAAIGVDELTKNEQRVFDLLRFRLRWRGIDRPKFLAATNPGGIGHAWVKRLWVDREFPPELTSRAAEFAFVRALPTDNPHLAPSYIKELRSLPEQLRKAYLEGLWTAFEGQVFAEWREDNHVCGPFEIPAHWKRWGSNDPGFTDPGVWYWHCADEHGGIYTYREMTFRSTPYSEQAAAVAKATGDEPVSFWVTGMDGFNRHPETGKSIVDYYAEGGLPRSKFVQPVHGPGARKAMAATVHEYLTLRPGADASLGPRSRWRVFRGCKDLIRTLPTLPADDLHPEQVAECATDHWYQAAGYGLQAWHANQSKAIPDTFPPFSAGAMFGTPETIAAQRAAEKARNKPFAFGR